MGILLLEGVHEADASLCDAVGNVMWEAASTDRWALVHGTQGIFLIVEYKTGFGEGDAIAKALEASLAIKVTVIN